MTTFWGDLETDNILLLAPRRVGKTSLMRKMSEDAGGQGMNPVFVDVSDCADELSFVERLYAAVLANNSGDLLWNHIKESWLGKTIQRVQKAGGAGFNIEFKSVEAAWSRLGEELAGALCKLEGRWLIQIDELPVFLLKLLNHDEPAARDRVREFLYWLRRLRLEFGEVRWFRLVPSAWTPLRRVSTWRILSTICALKRWELLTAPQPMPCWRRSPRSIGSL
jgi:AAA+ ATPase superfamily predicted ATPase